MCLIPSTRSSSPLLFVPAPTFGDTGSIGIAATDNAPLRCLPPDLWRLGNRDERSPEELAEGSLVPFAFPSRIAPGAWVAAGRIRGHARPPAPFLSNDPLAPKIARPGCKGDIYATALCRACR